MIEALKNYQEFNRGALPDQIMIYRDGVGGPTMEAKVKDFEVAEVCSAILGYASGYNPKIVYCLVNKRITHRLFEKDNGNGYVNPGPGTVLDTGLVENQGDNTFDFFLIPHTATVATALPVHFNIVYNTSSMNKD
jgi:hypothetical protein